MSLEKLGKKILCIFTVGALSGGSGGPLALYRRGVLTRGGGLNCRKNAVEMSLTSKTASNFIILRRKSEILSLFT